MKFKYLIPFSIILSLSLVSCGNEKDNDVKEIDICHPSIRNFIDTTDSNVEFDILKNFRKNIDRQYVPFELPIDYMYCQIYYDTDPNFSNPMYYFPEFGELSMCMPGKRYYYRVYDIENDSNRLYSLNYSKLNILPKCEPIIEDSFYVKDAPARFLNIEKINNFRDIGGWKTVDGKKVKYGMLYRAPALDSLTNFAKYQLSNMLGINSEIDLRHDAVDKTYSSFGVNYYKCGIIQYDGVVPNTERYSSYVKEGIQNIFSLLSEEDNYPAVFHCAAGSDRTGTLAFLIGGLLGVSILDLTKDFELTSFSEFGYRCRGNLALPYKYGLYQNDSFNYVNWGALVDAVMNYDTTVSTKEKFRKFVNEQYDVPTHQIDALERIMLE